MSSGKHSDGGPEKGSEEQQTPAPSDPHEPVNAPGIPPKQSHKARKRDIWDVVRKAYVECGVSQGELAALTGMGESRVQGRCDRGGWTAARKEHQEERRQLALRGVDQAALERRRKHEETVRTTMERLVTNADVVAQMVMAQSADWIERRNLWGAARNRAREAGEDDPGPFKVACPSKAASVNALTHALLALKDYDLKCHNEPTLRTRNEHAVVDVTELARAVLKG